MCVVACGGCLTHTEDLSHLQVVRAASNHDAKETTAARYCGEGNDVAGLCTRGSFLRRAGAVQSFDIA